LSPPPPLPGPPSKVDTGPFINFVPCKEIKKNPKKNSNLNIVFFIFDVHFFTWEIYILKEYDISKDSKGSQRGGTEGYTRAHTHTQYRSCSFQPSLRNVPNGSIR
jgi:hypothetical protein